MRYRTIPPRTASKKSRRLIAAIVARRGTSISAEVRNLLRRYKMKSLNRLVIVALSSILFMSATQVFSQTNPNLHRPAERSTRTRMALIEEVRHQLLTLPYYGIFDWLDATVEPNGKVIL